MFMKDVHGDWYEVADAALKGKKVKADKVREARFEEVAEKHKKILAMLSALDQEESEMLCEEVLRHIPENMVPSSAKLRPGGIGTHCINWGSSGGHAACDCACGHAACDCSSAWELDWGAALQDEAFAGIKRR